MKIPKLSDKKWYNGAVITCIGVILFVLLTNFSAVFAVILKVLGYFRPVILGVVIAYIISPLAKIFHYRVFHRLGARKIRWNLSVFCSFALMLLVLFLLIGMLLPQLTQSVVMFSQNFDNYKESLTDLIGSSPLGNLISEESIELMYDNAMSAVLGLADGAAENAMNVVTGAGKNIVSTAIGMILAVYLLIDVKRVLIGVRRFIETILPAEKMVQFMDFVLRCDTILMIYIAQSFLDALIIGTANAVFMLICRMPYIGLVSVIIGVTNLIPNFGPAIGAVIGAFILLLANPAHTVLFLVFCLILQTIDAYILKPKLFSGSLGVSGLTILISTIVLGNMFGIIGVLLSIPTAAIISFIYQDYYLVHCEKRNQI